MGFYDSCKILALSIITFFALPFSGDDGSHQAVLSFGDVDASREYPKFPAPSGPDSSTDFICKYPALGEAWKPCSSPDDRQCWLKGPNGNRFDISTNYEKFWPEGITREVSENYPPVLKALPI